MATYLSKLSALPQVRQDLVNSVREQIAAGTYDTPERLDAALNVLLSDSGN
jgi:negative regulator of flagellin synthesis FlgM